MKKRISMSFCLMCALFIYSLFGIRDVVLYIVSLFAGFNPIGILTAVCRIIVFLMPLAIVLLLYLNTKRDVKKIAYNVLVIYAVAILIQALLNLLHVGPFAIEFIYLILGISASVATCFLLFLAARSIKEEKIHGHMRTALYAALGINLFYVAFVFLINGYGLGTQTTVVAIRLLLPPVLEIFGIWFLPQTLLDYENCAVMDKKFVKVVICVLICVVLFGLVAKGVTAGSDSNDNDGSLRCNNCGGDGWDSANSCRCVWCGGDGKTSWNP